jgi:hypothetical protein
MIDAFVEEYRQKRLRVFNKFNRLCHPGVRLRHSTSNVLWEITEVIRTGNITYNSTIACEEVYVKIKSLNSNKTKTFQLDSNYFMYDIEYVPEVVKILYAEKQDSL